ncbi:unnamed protein product [Euphydryas editha]|uniref:Peptidase S8 pro-domain domain-containing protein n=1 Tax=Euphydryas editha TaxID=104508 RepID=A0AAU9TNV4_EUPED|nr:unnamed protein product [Euphydryas editha]
MVLSWRALALLAALQVAASVPKATYHNHFAVHVPAGEKHVDDIARRHGFVNHGQSLRIYRKFTQVIKENMLAKISVSSSWYLGLAVCQRPSN